jgi:nicotinamidase-related amidase
MQTHLVVIDPQNDFCDLPSAYLPRIAGITLTPALPVTGSHADMQRVAEIIGRGGVGLTEITVTLDAHHRIDIAHPPFWKMDDGSDVHPFTQIFAKEVRAGKYVPRIPESIERVTQYLDALEATGRYVHMVWPVHCEIGTWGQNLHDDVRRACGEWEVARAVNVAKILKGSNPWTEHYSAIRAEVPDPFDNGTQINNEFLERLHCSDRIYIVGEAGSHCVKATVEHVVENFSGKEINKLVLVTDCMSPVAGFEPQYIKFIDNMHERGVRISDSASVIDELIANA